MLLCGIFGTFGAHRFYVGRFFTGLLQLLMFAAAVAWIVVDFPYADGMLRTGTLLGQLLALFAAGLWPLVDFFLIVSSRFSDKAGNKLTEWT